LPTPPSLTQRNYGSTTTAGSPALFRCLPKHSADSDSLPQSIYCKLDRRFSNVAGANPGIRENRLVRTRAIGHLIREAPSILASEHVATEINSVRTMFNISVNQKNGYENAREGGDRAKKSRDP
jgi:hypothetical protein